MTSKNWGPGAKLRALRLPNVSRAEMSRFFETGASADIIESSRRAIGGAAAAIRRYAPFFRARRNSTFPSQGKIRDPTGRSFQ